MTEVSERAAAVLAAHQRRIEAPGHCWCGKWPTGDRGVPYPDHLAAELAAANLLAQPTADEAEGDERAPDADERIAFYSRGEEPLTEHEIESIEFGRCGPLRYGGPCWLMPGHKGPHHCYHEDLLAVETYAAGFRRRDPDAGLRERVEALANEWAQVVGETYGSRTLRQAANDLRAALAADTPTPAPEGSGRAS